MKTFALALALSCVGFAQSDRGAGMDKADVSVGRVRSASEGVEHVWPRVADSSPVVKKHWYRIFPALTHAVGIKRAPKPTPALASLQMKPMYEMGIRPHPYRLVARHPVAGCDNTAECGTIFYEYNGVNLRTSAGTTWQSELMGKVTTPTTNLQCNYMALTNAAVTPAEADTTLSSEISTNGLGRAQGTYTDASTTLTVPTAPTASVIGTTGAVSFWYWVAACNQGVCTTPSAASNNITTANATLSTTNYDKITWTGQNGAATYQIYRTTSSSAPSGTASVLVGAANPSCDSTLACTAFDQSNTLTSVTIPASNLTNFGKYTLVHTWTASGAQSAQAFGIFTASSSGVMCFEGTFTAVALNINDTFQLTETVYFKTLPLFNYWGI